MTPSACPLGFLVNSPIMSQQIRWETWEERRLGNSHLRRLIIIKIEILSEQVKRVSRSGVFIGPFKLLVCVCCQRSGTPVGHTAGDRCSLIFVGRFKTQLK